MTVLRHLDAELARGGLGAPLPRQGSGRVDCRRADIPVLHTGDGRR
jgi:hypothetical protein